MAKTFWIILLLWFSSMFVILLTFNFPFTNTEVREGYTAYSLVKTLRDTNESFLPLFFKADGNYLSTFGVYLRTIPIYIFGLTPVGIRIAGLILGSISIYLFYLIANKLFKSKNVVYLTTILFATSSSLIKSVIFEVGHLSILVVLLAVIYSLRFKKIVFLIGGLILVYTLFFERSFYKYLITQSVISDYKPSNYTYLIDKRLSFGLIYGSPLITDRVNYNRISLNKIFYGVNEIFKSIVKPFNFEALVSPFQSQTILAKELPGFRAFASLYYWEIPILILLVFLRLKVDKKIWTLLFAILALNFLFKNKFFILLIPAVVLLEGLFFEHILGRLKKTNLALTIFGVFLILNTYSLIDILGNRQQEWINEFDYKQFLIWSKINDADLNKKLVVTDRVGEPVFYYLVYKNIDPEYYFTNKVTGAQIDNNVQRVESVSNVYFKSFKYSSEILGKTEIWVGTGKDFGRKDDDIDIIKN